MKIRVSVKNLIQRGLELRPRVVKQARLIEFKYHFIKTIETL